VLPFRSEENSINAHVIRIFGPVGPIHWKSRAEVCSMN
jgi:hypothetical protein